jgi:hypothetical protein
MIRVLILSVCLFIAEVFVFIAVSPTLLEYLSGIDIKYLTFTNKQRRAVHNIQRQNALNVNNEPAVYVLGGSTSREFFPVDDQMTRIAGRPFVNMSTASQTIVDSLRLADNIKGKDTAVIYCLFPHKFMRFKPKDLPDSRYLMGANLKYPIHSSFVDDLLSKVTPRNLATGLLAELNVYCYLFKNYILEKNNIVKKKLAGQSTRPLETLFVNNKPPTQYYYHDRAYNRDRLTNKLMKHKKKIGPHLEHNLKKSFSFLGHIVRIARNNDVKITLVELPYSSTYERLYQRELDVYRQHRDAFLQKYSPLDFKHIDYDTYQGREELFYDHGHLLNRGRNYFKPFAMTLIP